MKLSFRQRRCPTEQQLAEYSDQQLLGAERHHVEEHLLACDSCLQQLGFLVRAQDSSPKATPDLLVRMAKGLGSPERKQPGRKWRPALAVASIVFVFALTLKVLQTRDRSNPEPFAPTIAANSAELPKAAEGEVTTRGISEPRSRIVFPTADSKVTARELEFRWTPTADAEYYEIEIVTESGDLVWMRRLNDKATKLPPEVRLVLGQTYYVWVSVQSRSNGLVQSQAVRFIAGS